MDLRPGFGVDLSSGFPVNPRCASFKPRRRVLLPSGKFVVTNAVAPIPFINASVDSTSSSRTLVEASASSAIPENYANKVATGRGPDTPQSRLNNASDINRPSSPDELYSSEQKEQGYDAIAWPLPSMPSMRSGEQLIGATPQRLGGPSPDLEWSRPGSSLDSEVRQPFWVHIVWSTLMMPFYHFFS